MSPEMGAGLTAVLGLSMLAGWFTGFRNRAYLGWLGLAFLLLSAAILTSARAAAAKELGGSEPSMGLLTGVLFAVALAAFVLALVSAVRETGRRIQEIRERHAAAEEALLEIVRAQRDRDGGKAADAKGDDDSTASRPDDES
jgi:hypothetical protein